MGLIFWLPVGMLIGVVFSESLRALIRKISHGRFFGPVPAKETVTLTDKV